MSQSWSIFHSSIPVNYWHWAPEEYINSQALLALHTGEVSPASRCHGYKVSCQQLIIQKQKGAKVGAKGVQHTGLCLIS